MKKIFTVFLLLLVSFIIPANVLAATSGPIGSNGLRAYSGPGIGQVTLEWSRVSLSGENYSIRYGTQPGIYPYLADHIGYISTYTVSNLVPDQTYYFALERIWTGNVSVGWEKGAEVSAVAASTYSSPQVTSGPVGRNLLSVTSLGNGQAKLSWRQFFPETTGWHIVYGPRPGGYQWGVLNAVSTVPGVTSYNFTIGLLPIGQRVYFAIVPVLGGQALYTTSEVSIFVQ